MGSKIYEGPESDPEDIGTERLLKDGSGGRQNVYFAEERVPEGYRSIKSLFHSPSL